MSLGCDVVVFDTDADAECEMFFSDDCSLLRSANALANVAGTTVGEKLARVVGFGASRESGGFELGFNIGGDKGNGVREEKVCFPIGDVTVEGGEIGKEFCR